MKGRRFRERGYWFSTPIAFLLAYQAASPIAADINHARDGKCAEDVQDVR